MFAWLIVALAALAVIVGLLLQRIWPNWDNPRNALGSRLLLAGIVVGLLSLGWALYLPFASVLMLSVLALSAIGFAIGLLGSIALGMAPAPSMESQWSIYLLGGSGIVGLFALGWNAHGWILG